MFSSPALKTPYQPTEPKSEAARANVMRRMKSSLVECPEGLLLQALEHIKKNYDAEWCLPRKVSPLVFTRQRRKRKFGGNEVANDGASAEEPMIEIPMYNSLLNSTTNGRYIALDKNVPNDFSNVQRITHRWIHNPHSCPVSLSIKSVEQTYVIPPESAFCLMNINEDSVADFSTAARSLYSTPTASAGPGQFDLILLDPPWDNRSVRRSREYNTICKNADPMNVLQDMLGEHIAPEALIACWITNKKSTRDYAIQTFNMWGVELTEEWIWLKTTINGQPVTDIKGLWRKPYEVLLLGRKSDHQPGAQNLSSSVEHGLCKRVIVTVPDFHSRKPCLKTLLEPMITDPTGYRALEIFARNLTSGWCSWGNEPIRYNWQGYWPKSCT